MYRGVCYIKKRRKWKSCISVNSKNHHLGFFGMEASGTLVLAGMANTAGQWYALTGCCGRHCRLLERTY